MGVRVGPIKKAESQRIDLFELWCWRRLWRVPWTARRSNQSVLREINPEYSFKVGRTWMDWCWRTGWEGLVLKMKLQFFGHLMQRLTGNDPDAEKDWRQEEKGMTENEMVRWHHQLSGHEFEQTQGDGEGERSLACCSSWGRKESDST